jgi:TolB-like protein/pimeloyl-ACP methyl ester carboxylesterase/predicted Ser/Thr protein kinase
LTDEVPHRSRSTDQPTEPADADWLAAAERIELGARMGRYQLRSVVGAGGMGVVFEALDPELERPVAVKVLRASGEAETAALRREGQIMARLAHPNVIRIYDVGVENGHAFVAMEFVGGGTLADWLARAPRTPAEIIASFVQAGRGLAAAHDARLVHRDFKPANVLVGADDRVLVTDFGIARPAGLAGADAGHPTRRSLALTETRTHGVVGTPAYMAPEQLLGGAVDARADQFSFCVALWRALFGAPPFPGDTLGALADAVMSASPEPPHADAAARVTPAVRRALERGLRPEPAARFGSMHELLAELERAPARALSSIAVMPFDDLGTARDQAHLCESIAEEILTSLARVDGLRVAARGSSFALRSSTTDPRVVGDELGVDMVLVGTVRMAGGRLRVAVQVVDTADGTQRWAGQFDGAIADVLEFQAEIAIGVAAAMRGIMSVADRRPGNAPKVSLAPTREQEVHFTTTADGLRIAYSAIGFGPLIVRVLGHFTHLEKEWEWPELRRFWESLTERNTVVRYDGRGIGLSGRFAGEFTEKTRQLDLDAVLDAIGAKQAALLGISEGGWTAAAYAVEHPARVSHLILYGAYCRGAQARPGYDREEDRALITLIRKGWGRDTPAFRQVITSQFFRSDADPALLAHFNELQRVSADGDTAARYHEACHRRGDGRDLFRQVEAPTLILHYRDDLAVSADEGTLLASIIPGAQLVLLPSGMHYFPTDADLALKAASAIARFLQTQ